MLKFVRSLALDFPESSKSSKGMISSSNFVEIARLVVLARKNPGTSPFSSLLDPLP